MNMPHAISPASSPPTLADDTMMSEAVAEPAEVGATETADEDMAESQEVETKGEEKANLEDIFDDDDEDDEFASSAPTKMEVDDESSQEEQYAKHHDS